MDTALGHAFRRWKLTAVWVKELADAGTQKHSDQHCQCWFSLSLALPVCLAGVGLAGAVDKVQLERLTPTLVADALHQLAEVFKSECRHVLAFSLMRPSVALGQSSDPYQQRAAPVREVWVTHL